MTSRTTFPLNYWETAAPPRTLRELEMMRLSAEIRAKPQWFVKMNDADIVAGWTREAAAQGLTEAQIRYVLDELAYYAERRDETTGIEVSVVDGVWQSDTLIDDELWARLRDAVRVLEMVPDAERDWHPGSNEQVLDLVHPSLFCLVREVSVPGLAWPEPESGSDRYAYSKKFQWLPTDVEISDDGDAVFRSYVNNVHPVAHHELDAVLPEFFARLRPLFDNVLTDLRHPRPLRMEPELEWDEPMSAPEAPEFSAPAVPADDARVDLRSRRLQVIVKLANIHLTPDKPEYPGGSWHVEGMVNEHIVSTAIYYWESENTTASHLGFRTAISDPDYEQNDEEGVREVYGLNDDDPMNQLLGSVHTRAGRCLAFPNILQHRVAPFRLADPTRPGHRKILVFFLVDPSVTITSTADVAPQQPWSPTSTMTLDQAKEYREQLMQERKFFVDEHNDEVYERGFSLCEH